ncbi:MAG: MFS transporter [Burkholderiales bacterium]|jgi:MFS family permease|nr:MAG: MFS transporter [Burkholderiales bacterium]
MSSSAQRSATVVITASIVVLLIAMGVRATFGLLMQPMGLDKGFSRETFSLAFAIQNLVWGLGAPLFGALSDKYGSGRTIALGALLYAIGLLSMGYSDSAATLYLSAGVLVGLGQGGTTFGVILGVVARAVPPERRSLALGMASAGGSAGQFLMVPFAQQLIAQFDWHTALLLLSVAASFGMPLALLLQGRAAAGADQLHQSLSAAFRQALGHRSYHFLFWSFFVCGFHVSFITLHLPSFVVDGGLSAFDGALAIGLIGLFNVVGSYGCGWLGGRYSKKNLLGSIYALRAVFIALLLLFPLTPLVLYVFAAGIGLLWLGTVPLTSGLIGQIYGLRYTATLYGLVFLGHQIGSFIGVWLGGWTFERFGSYDLVWWLGIALALAAAALSWPIDERAMAARRADDAVRA